jgi:hypothetical protein
MNLSIPAAVRALVRVAAVRAGAAEGAPIDESAWVVRAVREKLERDGEALGLPVRADAGGSAGGAA